MTGAMCHVCNGTFSFFYHRLCWCCRTLYKLKCATADMQADEELAQYILKAGILPYFALSWYITWFAHDVQSLPQIARLFDLFMASHPLMPLYVGAAAMKVRTFC